MRKGSKSIVKYRCNKRRQFRNALSALNALEKGSLSLPDDVCLKIWKAIRELQTAQDTWIGKHEEHVEKGAQDMQPDGVNGGVEGNLFW